MKRSIAIIVILALVAGAGIAYFIAIKPQSSSSKSTNVAASSVNACDILTPAIAKQFLGSNASQPSGSAGDASTPDITVSNCLYSSSSTDPSKTSSVDVLVRAANTSDGTASNQAQFAHIPSDMKIVSGVGDKAYYDPTFHQLNILKGGNWYIVSSYTGSPANATLDTNKKLAGALHFQ